MFDIGFWELTIIGVVALLVIGPNRMPEVARTAGLYVGKVRRFIAAVQKDINVEINKAEELKSLLDEQKKIVERHEIIEELNSTVSMGGDSQSGKQSTPVESDTPSESKGDGKKE